MPHIVATERALWWAVGEPVIETGITPVGALTVSGLPMVYAADENEFLGAVAGKASDYKPLPGMGEWVDEGVYGWNNGLVIVRQSHTRQHNPDDAGVGALYGLYRPGEDVWEWVAGEALAVGARRSWEDVIYILYRDIGANNWFPPPQVPAHWEVWTEAGPQPWVQPYGGSGTYESGAIVTHNGFTWLNIIPPPTLNVWEPGVYGWEKVE